MASASPTSAAAAEAAAAAAEAAEAKTKTVRIGCYSAFWGDSVSAARQLVCATDHPHYVVADYLAEVTMGILAQQRLRQRTAAGSSAPSSGGFVGEFVTYVWKSLMHDILRRGIKIVTNAGGLDPVGLKRAIEEAAREAGVEEGRVVVAAVEGDDVFDRYDALRRQHPDAVRAFGELDDKSVAQGVAGASDVKGTLLSVNAYTGAFPIARALARGANVVVVGRSVDSALVVGPLIHEYGCKPTDYDQLATASLAGHIIECGCQATGGNFTDWQQTKDGWSNMGYPIVEFRGGLDRFSVTKPRGTGGLINRFTVGEQMLYEVLDPANYYLPDVTLDMTGVTLDDQQQSGSVLVRGARGKPATEYYKLSAVYVDGWRMSAEGMVSGNQAAAKARAVGEAIFARSRRVMRAMGIKEDFDETNVETLGTECTYGPGGRLEATRECVMRMSARHSNPQALRILAMEIAPAVTNMAPGIAMMGSGRPRPQPRMVHVASLLRKEHVCLRVHLTGQAEAEEYVAAASPSSLQSHSATTQRQAPTASDDTISVMLWQVCVGRSGDKGDACNIGLMSRHPGVYPYVLEQVTASRVQQQMQHLLHPQASQVRRYELPGVHGVNLVLTHALGGGGLSSLRVDRQGKTYAQQLLASLTVRVPRAVAMQCGAAAVDSAKL
ncbi:hypothetical protein RI367_006811 [Sorochytrium milnesiophthora]